MKRISIVVNGQVQGVGFRYFAQEVADLLKISGWARNNTISGDVEIEAQGDETQLEMFIERIKAGPALASVKGCQSTEIALIENEREFRIRH
jgi:acylphosphatase